MATDPAVFRDVAYVFAAAVAGGGLAWLTRQPLILGYVLGGILISPLTPGPSVSDLSRFELFAQIGVVLLMFSIGIEFSFRDLARVRWVALLGAPLTIALLAGLGAATGAGLGWGVAHGAVLGMVISVSSTMVLVRLLLDRGELHSQHGRIMIGTSLVEDLAAVVLIVLIPMLGDFGPGRMAAIGLALAKAALLVLVVGYLAAKVIPLLLNRVARTQNQELFLLVALAIGLGTAALTQAAGLSLALGAFLAGLVISESDYAHETLARLLPLRETFGALFFVTVGALIDPRSVMSQPGRLGVIVALVVVGKSLVRIPVVWSFGASVRTAVLVGVGLAQIGEFSFVLVQVAKDTGRVGADLYHAVLAASLISILLNALLLRAVPGWLGRERRAWPEGPSSAAPEILRGHVVLCGFGRVGSTVGEALETFSIPFVVIERDPDIIRGLRARGVPCVYGDAAHSRVLEQAGARSAALAVVTLPEMEHARDVVRRLRALAPGVPVLARAHAQEGRERLARAGATEVIQPELEAAATLIRHALKRLSLPQERVLAYLERFRDAMEMSGAPSGQRPDSLPELREVAVGEGALADQSLREARIRERLGVTVVAIERADGGAIANPSADTVLRSGDRVRVFGLPGQIEDFRREAAPARE